MTGIAAHAVAGPLSAAQIRSFRDQGYLIVRGLIGRARLEALRGWVDEVQSWPEARGKYMMYFEDSHREPGRRVLNRVENLMPYHDGLKTLMESQEMRGAVGQLLGEPAVLFKDKINFKLPGGGGFAAHQDVQAGWNRYASLHVTAMVSVDRTSVANGCLELVPGAHDRGLVGESWKPLTGEDFGDADYVTVETEPGDGVFFDSYAPHRSAPNHTDEARRVLYFTYNRSSEGDRLARYYADKRASYPPDIEREPGREYVFRV